MYAFPGGGGGPPVGPPVGVESPVVAVPPTSQTSLAKLPEPEPSLIDL